MFHLTKREVKYVLESKTKDKRRNRQKRGSFRTSQITKYFGLR